jgi:hypothetical protein
VQEDLTGRQDRRLDRAVSRGALKAAYRVRPSDTGRLAGENIDCLEIAYNHNQCKALEPPAA